MSPTFARIRDEAIKAGNMYAALTGLIVWDRHCYAKAVDTFVELYRKAKGLRWRRNNPIPRRRLDKLRAKLKRQTRGGL